MSQQSFSHRLAIIVRGVVQGVGFRPFVYNLARAKGLGGWVLNEADLVRVEVQGDKAALEEFVELLRSGCPPQARIDELDIREIPCEKDSPAAFEIRASLSQSVPRPTIPADLATCVQCLAEIRDPAQRRYGYPFTNCTNCGPRWSIIEQLPYDRRGPRWLVLKCVRSAARSTRIPPTGDFTPSRLPARNADRIWNCLIARENT